MLVWVFRGLYVKNVTESLKKSCSENSSHGAVYEKTSEFLKSGEFLKTAFENCFCKIVPTALETPPEWRVEHNKTNLDFVNGFTVKNSLWSYGEFHYFGIDPCELFINDVQKKEIHHNFKVSFHSFTKFKLVYNVLYPTI